MVFKVVDEGGWIHPKRGGSTPLLLPGVSLSLKEETVLDGRNEFLWRSTVVLVISLFSACKCDQCAVMKVVVPHCVKSVSALIDRTSQAGMLWFVFCDRDGSSPIACLVRSSRNCCQNVLLGRIKDGLCRIKAQTIDVEFTNPVFNVSQKKFAHWQGVRSIKINGFAPLGGFFCEVIT